MRFSHSWLGIVSLSIYLLSAINRDRASLSYEGRGNVLEISTPQDFARERRFVVRVYDVTDILRSVPEFRGSPEIDLTTQSRSGSSPAIFTGGAAGDDETDRRGAEFENHPGAEALSELIMNTIEPRSWDYADGPGSVRVFRTLLVVRNSVAVHEQIAGRLLEN